LFQAAPKVATIRFNCSAQHLHQQPFANPNREAARADFVAHVAVWQDLVTHAKKIEPIGSTVEEAVAHLLKEAKMPESLIANAQIDQWLTQYHLR
jgi:hypothetical protein